MKSDWSSTLPPSRATGDAPTGGVAGDMNLVRSALTEIRSYVPNAAADVSAVAVTLINAKGDLLVGSADNTVVRVPVGVAGQRLTVNPDEPSGLIWETPPDVASAVTQNFQTGTAYTLVLADAGAVVETSNSSANTVTIPPNSSVAFPTGTPVMVRQYGTGQTTLLPGAGVTLRSYGAALKLAGQYAEATLTKRGTNEWIVSGDLTT